MTRKRQELETAALSQSGGGTNAESGAVFGVSEVELQAVQKILDEMPEVKGVKAQEVVKVIGNFLMCVDVAVEAEHARQSILPPSKALASPARIASVTSA